MHLRPVSSAAHENPVHVLVLREVGQEVGTAVVRAQLPGYPLVTVTPEEQKTTFSNNVLVRNG